jgi:hypothetical protein
MRIRSIAIAASLVLLLASCGKTVDTACAAFQPITYSAAGDTPETVTQVRQHNAAWKALCK